MDRTNDENQIKKDQIKAFEEQINATKSSSYDIAAFPENYELEKKFGFKMKGDDFEFLKVAERLKNYINTKDKEIEVRKIGVTIKCIKADMQGKNIQMSIWSDTVDKGTMNLTFSKNKKDELTITIQRAKGAGWLHAQLMFQSVRYFVDCFLDGSLSKTQLNSMERKAPKIPSCTNCGKNFKTVMGSKEHKCEVLNSAAKHDCEKCHDSFLSLSELKVHKLKMHNIEGESLHCNICAESFVSTEHLSVHNKQIHDIPPSKRIKENVRPDEPNISKNPKFLNGLLKHVGENIVVTSEPFPKPQEVTTDQSNNKANKNTKTKSVDEYINTNLPGKSLHNVIGDGACQARSVSLGSVKDQKHSSVFAKSKNRLLILKTGITTKISILFPNMCQLELSPHRESSSETQNF